jgi:hypothetical protein
MTPMWPAAHAHGPASPAAHADVARHWSSRQQKLLGGGGGGWGSAQDPPLYGRPHLPVIKKFANFHAAWGAGGGSAPIGGGGPAGPLVVAAPPRCLTPSGSIYVAVNNADQAVAAAEAADADAEPRRSATLTLCGGGQLGEAAAWDGGGICFSGSDDESINSDEFVDALLLSGTSRAIQRMASGELGVC